MAHGGPNKAVYAYAVEDTRWWEQEFGQSLSYGQFGENLTTEGIEVNDALIGLLLSFYLKELIDQEFLQSGS